MSTCPYCPGACAQADLGPLLSADLAWLWQALAATADRRGDASLTTGRARLSAPADPAARAAAVGLLGGGQLRAGQHRTLDLAQLTDRLRARGPRLTPGAVAAHAARRPLAVRAGARRDRESLLEQLRADLDRHVAHLPTHVVELIDPDTVWARLRTSGWTARLAAAPDPRRLLADAAVVLAALPKPPERTDRRTLVPTNPHALDEGSALAGLVLALAGRSGTRARAGWDALGVDFDDLTGGLLSLGLHPAGWTLPPDAVASIPPRELARCTWPGPAGTGWAFVTENPSVMAAAATLATGTTPVRLLCTVGTPSAVEVRAVAALAEAGWKVAVRADFDPAGLAHMRALLAACPSATPWRMGEGDYLTSATPAPHGAVPLVVPVTDTPWDPRLAQAMSEVGTPAFEEALLDALLEDITRGAPARTRGG